MGPNNITNYIYILYMTYIIIHIHIRSANYESLTYVLYDIL